VERSINTNPREWDAETYDAVSDPQFEWGTEVLGRLELNGDEVAIDAGCGSGKVTEKLLERIPNGRLLAVDGSEAMIEKAKERLRGRATYLVIDLAELEVEQPVDLIFSTATFHWIADHDRLFAHLYGALKPGGRLIAQCGGEGNVAEHARVIAIVAARPEFATHLSQMTGQASPMFAAGSSPSPSPPSTRLSSRRPSPWAHSSPSSPASCAVPSPKPSSRSRSARSPSTTCASTSRHVPQVEYPWGPLT
jgi:SAM-dependent methyltransferase